MKKNIALISIAFLTLFAHNFATAQSSFSQAVKTCETYSKEGIINHNSEAFNLLITLKQNKKNDKCIYKEKIYQDKDYQMLTCEFKQKHLGFISESMDKFGKIYYKEIAKNPIFEAKLTTNAEVFQKYLADPEICKITYSKK